MDEEAAAEVVGLGLGSALDVLGIGLASEVFTGWGLSEEVGATVGWAVVVGGMLVGWLPDIPDNKASMSCLGQILHMGIFWLKMSSLTPSAST